MSEYEDYFSENAIIADLCKRRVRLAGKRHAVAFLESIAQMDSECRKSPLPDVVASRQDWHSYRPRSRKGLLRSEVQTIAATRATESLLRRNPNSARARQLKDFICEIKEHALGAGPRAFEAPRLVLIQKKGSSEFRALGLFPLRESMLDCITARYLREQIQQKAGSRHLGPAAATHHQAVEAMWRMRMRHSDRPLYVAKCDIKGFFDCVEHNLAWESLMAVLRDADTRLGRQPVDSRALRTVRAFLDSFAFSENVWRERHRRVPKSIAWPIEELTAIYGDPENQRIGIPQGSALSALLASCVLQKADQAVLKFCHATGGEIQYHRFGDDAIILALDRHACADAYESYLEALEDLKLPYHQPITVEAYGKEFWASKSKRPFAWGPLTSSGQIPWLDFVGYQLRHDGGIRIRPSSIKRHRQKLTREADRVLFALGRRSTSLVGSKPFRILEWFRRRLTAICCGRGGSKRRGTKIRECWAAGFPVLLGKPIVGNALSELDRHRERQIRRVKRRLAMRFGPESLGGASASPPEYVRFASSYSGQFPLGRRNDRPSRSAS